MQVHVIGINVSPPVAALTDQRLEELAFDTVRDALASAGVARNELDSVTLATSDEMDGRAISSMLMAAPSGAYLRDEIRVTDSGMTGLALGAMRVATGRFDLGLVVSWNNTSVIDVQALMRMRAEPFFLRPIGMNGEIASALRASSASYAHGIDEQAVTDRVILRQSQANANPRAMRSAALSAAQIRSSPLIANPLRKAHMPASTDGCVAIVLASPRWLQKNPARRPLACLRAMSWGIDQYRLDAQRLSSPTLFASKLSELLRRSGRTPEQGLDLLEIEAQTAWDDLLLERAAKSFGVRELSPSGGAWSQNPIFCTGLINVAEVIARLNTAQGSAGAIDFAVAHSSHGYAQQGHMFAAFERSPA